MKKPTITQADLHRYWLHIAELELSEGDEVACWCNLFRAFCPQHFTLP